MSEFIPELEPDEIPVTGRMKLAEVLAKPAPEPEKTPEPDQARAVAHLSDGVLTNLGHAARHLDTLQDPVVQKDPERLKFNISHLEDHLAESLDHARRLQAALAAYYPDVAAELGKLHNVSQMGAALPPPARSVAGYEDEYCPVVTDERDELRNPAAELRPARSAQDDHYNVVFTRPGGPEPA
jgi:hypothetical protein